MEDLDAPRCVPGAADEILRALDRCGFAWDGGILYQSTRTESYAAALERLRHAGRLFRCGCSRREIADSALTPGAPIYPGTCRNGLPPGRGPRSWRVRVDDESIEFDDAIQGRVRQRLAEEVGDFVLRRADGCFAYQLAVVVDDAQQRITDVARGADLLGSTPRQIFLQRLLQYPQPRYAHVPVAVNAAAEKLSKQTIAPAVVPGDSSALVKALQFLGQDPPADLERSRPADVWTWAIPSWNLARIPCRRTIQV